MRSPPNSMTCSGTHDAYPSAAWNPPNVGTAFAMTTVQRPAPSTHPAVVALLFASVGLTMLLAVLGVLSLAIGDRATGVQLSVLALAVAGATRFVTERANRSFARG